MRAELDAEQAGLVAEVDRLAGGASGAGPRDIMARLGDERLLAVHYPVEYGGRGLKLAHHAAVYERIGELGLPDLAYLVTVQAVGCTILEYGTGRQRESWLRDIAAGRLFASLLLSEQQAGSDIVGLATTATPDGDGWRISGTKTWSVYTGSSRLALCSARTRKGTGRYDGISMFLLDPTGPGVTIVPTPRAAGEPYCTVTLDDVRVGPDALLGPLHDGWTLMVAAIGYERIGFDCLTRAMTWLARIEQETDRLPPSRQQVIRGELVRLRFQAANARALAYHAVHTATAGDGHMDEIAAAYSKIACGRVGQAVARLAGLEFANGPAWVHDAVAEAPEFTIAAGVPEIQLGLIAAEFPIGRAVR